MGIMEEATQGVADPVKSTIVMLKNPDGEITHRSYSSQALTYFSQIKYANNQ
jgi:hypothetical protein